MKLKVNKEDCMLYAGVKSDGGYGRICIDGKYYPIYRLVYESIYGEIPEGLEPDHLCETPACFNPDHIEPVTHQENTRRHYERKYGDSCKNGHSREFTKPIWNKGDGFWMRYCAVCHKIANQRYRERLRLKSQEATNE
jgi:hypothetical protein